VVNRVAGALKITIAELFSPLDEPYRSRSRKRRTDADGAAK
jgi:hypothetical protein